MSLIQIFNRIKPYNVSALTKLLSTKQEIPSAEGTKPKKPKTAPIPRITLVSADQVSISTLEEAQKLAKRRDLKLVKILDLDTKTQRPIYKLMSGAEYHTEHLKQSEEKKKERQNSAFKGDKSLIINSNISEHDLKIHCNKISKWIGKRFEVRVLINGDSNDSNKSESVFNIIEKNLKTEGEGIPRILQKRQKGSELKFQIVPPKNENKEPKQPKVS